MKTFNQTERIAFNQQHPKTPSRGWEVIQFGKVVFESNFPGLCEHHIKTNQLKGATKRQKI